MGYGVAPRRAAIAISSIALKRLARRFVLGRTRNAFAPALGCRRVRTCPGGLGPIGPLQPRFTQSGARMRRACAALPSRRLGSALVLGEAIFIIVGNVDAVSFRTDRNAFRLRSGFDGW